MIIQSLFYFDTPAVAQLLSGSGTNLFGWDGSHWTQLAGWTAASDTARLAMAQGVDKVLISDGSGNLQIWDGTTFTDCGNEPTCPPVGATILTWHTGRMFASGIAALPDTFYVSNRLTFGLGQWNPTTRSFRIGNGDGEPVVAMAPMQNFVLCVFKSNSIWLVETNPQAEPANFSADQNTAVLSAGIGCVGRDAWCAYGNDILFMAQDGVRSVQRMQAAAGQWQLSAPLSQPIQTYIDRINRSAWDKICAIKYQEFAFFFVPLDISAVNNCVLVWNGRLGKWCGAWTGWNGQQVAMTRFNGVNRLVFGDDQGLVNQWKDTEDAASDDTYRDNGSPYPTQLWTRSMLFGEAVNNKSAYSTVLRFSQGNATVNLTWCADNTNVKTWVGAPTPSGDILGQDVLPFLLQSTSPTKVQRGIRGLAAFNEAFLKVESDAGWWALRNVTAGAFINPLRL